MTVLVLKHVVFPVDLQVQYRNRLPSADAQFTAHGKENDNCRGEHHFQEQKVAQVEIILSVSPHNTVPLESLQISAQKVRNILNFSQTLNKQENARKYDSFTSQDFSLFTPRLMLLLSVQIEICPLDTNQEIVYKYASSRPCTSKDCI